MRSVAAACLELADLPRLLSALLGGALLLGVLWIGTRKLRGGPTDEVPVRDSWQISTFPVSGRKDGQEPTKRKRKEKDAVRHICYLCACNLPVCLLDPPWETTAINHEDWGLQLKLMSLMFISLRETRFQADFRLLLVYYFLNLPGAYGGGTPHVTC